MKKVENQILVVAIALLLFWPRIVKLFNPEPDEEPDLKVDDTIIPDSERTDCEHIVYQPLSMAGLHTDPTLPKGYCVRGDSYFDNIPHETGDAYADEQAEDFESLKTSESKLDGMSSVTIILKNTTAAELDATIVDSTSEVSTWEGDFTFLTNDYTDTQIDLVFQLPTGKSMVVFWGDGNSSAVNGNDTTDVSVSSTYSGAGTYYITLGGDYLDLTKINCDRTHVSGDVSGWSALTSLTFLHCGGNSLTGDVSTWSALTSLTRLYCGGNSLTGDVSTWSALTSLTQLHCDSNSLDFDNTTAWTALSLGTTYFSNNSMTSTQVDNALIAFAGGPFLNTTIYLDGTNDARTPASDAALATLLAAGNDVRVNEYVDYGDWYLPSKDELNEMYVNLHLEGVGGFASAYYWSSTEINVYNAWIQSFGYGNQYGNNKNYSYYVRAIRTFTAALGAYLLRDIGPEGGLIFYVNETTYMEAKVIDQSSSQRWSNKTVTSVEGTSTAIGTGQANTTAIISQYGHTDSAAKLCDDLVTNN